MTIEASPGEHYTEAELEILAAIAVDAQNNMGHLLGVWHRLDERLIASLCLRCGSAGLLITTREGRQVRGGSTLRWECGEPHLDEGA